MKNKELIFIFTEDPVNYYNTALGYTELAEILGRPVASVRNSVSSIRKYNKTHRKNKKELIVKDKNGNKYLLITETELKEGK